MADSQEQLVKPRSAIVRFAQTRPLTLFFLLVPRVIRQTAQGPNSDSFDIPVFITGAFGPTVGALISRWSLHR
jgi:hypothetical protein